MLTVERLSFSYGKKEVLKELSFSLKDGEILAVMGPSGCGKTTLLHLIAGLQDPKKGRVTQGHVVSNATKTAYVFQEPRLFPWLTVEENLSAVIADRTVSKEALQAVLSEVELADAAKLYPSALSGGMKSRVALARALLYGADLYLLDEPFAALDQELRERLSALLRKKIKDSGASAIFVTHQQADAEALADRILELK